MTVAMVSEHGQYFEDTLGVSFHENFDYLLKWAALLPFATAAIAIAATSRPAQGQLPITQRHL